MPVSLAKPAIFSEIRNEYKNREVSKWYERERQSSVTQVYDSRHPVDLGQRGGAILSIDIFAMEI